MILIDTTAWVEFLRGTGSEANRSVRELVGSDRVATTDPVVAEVTAGARSAGEARRLRRMLDAARFYPIRPVLDFEWAARIFADLRRRGLTPPPLPECLVAAVALEHDLEVLHHGAGFERIGSVVPLRVVPPSVAPTR